MVVTKQIDERIQNGPIFSAPLMEVNTMAKLKDVLFYIAMMAIGAGGIIMMLMGIASKGGML